MRAGLAMFFVTLDDPALMEIADQIVAELGIEHFFNIQLVGDHVIEINPRISTIVYQEDLNIPYLGVKRALGEISPDELVALARGSARAERRSAISTSSSGTRERRPRIGVTVPAQDPSLAPTHPGHRHGSGSHRDVSVPGLGQL